MNWENNTDQGRAVVHFGLICVVMFAQSGAVQEEVVPKNASHQKAGQAADVSEADPDPSDVSAPTEPTEMLEAPAFFTDPTKPTATEISQGHASDVLDPAVLGPSLSLGRNSLAIQQSLLELTRKSSRSVVEIAGEHRQTTLGTIVSADGLIVAKYSMLPSSFFCRLPGGKKVKGKLIGIHPQKDLALIQVKESGLVPIPFAIGAPTVVSPGEFVISVGTGNRSVGMGMVTVDPQTFSMKQTECPNCIDFGATVSKRLEHCQVDVEGQAMHLWGLKVRRVYPRTASESTGLLVGDFVRSINGTELTDREQMIKITKSLKVGQHLSLGVVREGQSVELSTRIKSFSQRTMYDRWGGGPFSGRRFGFGTVIAHDSVVQPERCGGPLVTLEGRVVGVNVARSMRVATFAIPIADVHHFIRYVRPHATLVEVGEGR